VEADQRELYTLRVSFKFFAVIVIVEDRNYKFRISFGVPSNLSNTELSFFFILYWT
jgi:hypothetical protein